MIVFPPRCPTPTSECGRLSPSPPRRSPSSRPSPPTTSSPRASPAHSTSPVTGCRSTSRPASCPTRRCPRRRRTTSSSSSSCWRRPARAAPSPRSMSLTGLSSSPNSESPAFGRLRIARRRSRFSSTTCAR